MINGIAMKGRRIMLPFLLQIQIMEKLYRNNIGIKKMRLLVRELMYWVNMIADIKST